MQKKINKFISLILVFMCTFFTFSNVNSLTIRHNELQMFDPNEGGYLRNFHVLTDGSKRYFCLELNMGLPQNVTYEKAEKLNYKYVTLIENGLNQNFAPFNLEALERTNPNISIADAYYFRTQMALWLYNGYDVKNNATYGDDSPSISAKLRSFNWITDVINSASSSQAPTIPTIDVNLSGSTTLKLNSGSNYYESELITVTSNQSPAISLSLQNVSGAKVVNSNGGDVSSVNSGSQVRVMVPTSNIEIGKPFSIKLTATSSISGTVKAAYKYVPTVEKTYQSIVIIENEPYNNTDTAEMTFTASKSNKVIISKKGVTGSDELPGATLQVEDEKGNIVKYCTSSSGAKNSECKWVSTNKPYEIENMPIGTYYLVETIAPDGYVLNKSKVKFVIDTNTTTKNVEMKNEYTKVEISKVNEEDNEYLKGATLEVQDSNGKKISCKVLNSNGEVEELKECTWVSDDKPKTIVGLKKGTYYLVETAAPDGYVLNQSKVKFVVDETAATKTVKMKNKYTKVEISKVNEEDNKYLKGATLEVQDSKGKKISCKVLSSNGEVEELKECTWVSGDKPKTIVGLKKGTYYLVETAAPDGYILNQSKVKFVVDETTATKTVKMKNKYTKVEISKVNEIDDRNLKGATLEVLDSKGKKISCKVLNSKGKIEELKECTWVSDDKPKTIVGLKKGTYYLVETAAPNGYILFEDKIEFKVDQKQSVVKVKMVNSLEVEVPNTLSSRSTLLLAFAMFDIAVGIGILIYVKKNRLNNYE